MADDADEVEYSRFDYGTAIYRFLRRIVIVGAVAFILYTVASQSYPPRPPTGSHAITPGTPPSRMPNTIPDVRPDRLEVDSPPTPPPTASDASKDIHTESTPEHMLALETRLQSLESQLGQMKTQAASGNSEQLERLEARLAEQDNLITGLKSQVSDMQALKQQVDEAEMRHGRQLSALASFGILKSTVLSGESFAAPLQQLYALTDGMEGNNDARVALDSLKPFAEQGISTWPVLQSSLGDAVVKALAPDADAHSWENSLQSLIRIRKEGEFQHGHDDQSVMARAEAKFARTDLPGGLKELETLSSPTATRMTPWMQDAKAHLAALRALDALQLALASSSPPPHDAPASAKADDQ